MVAKAMCDHDMPACEREGLAGLIGRTGAVLGRAHGLADDILGKLNGPSPAGECDKGARFGGVLNESAANADAAAVLVKKLEEISALLG
jgi:hypothetical protein